MTKITSVVFECGTKPADAVMVGDTTVDVLTGQNAGARATVSITHGFGRRADLVAAGADYIVDSLVELPAILKTIEQ